MFEYFRLWLQVGFGSNVLCSFSWSLIYLLKSALFWESGIDVFTYLFQIELLKSFWCNALVRNDGVILFLKEYYFLNAIVFSLDFHETSIRIWKFRKIHILWRHKYQNAFSEMVLSNCVLNTSILCITLHIVFYYGRPN